jgi:hypothetical protein
LTTSEKRSAYERIFSVLPPGGIFVNGDLFSYASKSMSDMATKFSINWIRKQFTDPEAHLRPLRDSLGHSAQTIMDAWIDHCTHHNLPDPIESQRADEVRIIGQADMLLDVGFAEVACPFRYWGIGLLWAKR